MDHTEKGHIDPPPKYEPPSAGFHVDPNQHEGHPPSGYPPSGYPPAGACPPPQGYQASAGQTTVIVQPMNMPLPGANFRFMQFPAYIVCQHCQATVTTSTEYTTGLLTWAVAGVICLFGLWLGCCLIPFCIDGTKDVIHRCPNCKQVVGKFAHF